MGNGGGISEMEVVHVHDGMEYIYSAVYICVSEA